MSIGVTNFLRDVGCRSFVHYVNFLLVSQSVYIIVSVISSLFICIIFYKLIGNSLRLLSLILCGMYR